MKNILITIFIFVSLHSIFSQSNISNADTTNKNNYLIIKHDYTLSYNESLHHANWVSWTLNKSHIGKVERQNDFSVDKTLPKGFILITPKDYSRSGYDRGHLCNSQAWTDSLEDNQETFLMTNMIPQSPKCNRGTWKELEDYCQKLALSEKILTIYAGSYQNKGYISSKNIDVPKFCWKVIFIKDVKEPICVIMPNSEDIKTGWINYKVDLDYIENITKYKF